MLLVVPLPRGGLADLLVDAVEAQDILLLADAAPDAPHRLAALLRDERCDLFGRGEGRDPEVRVGVVLTHLQETL